MALEVLNAGSTSATFTDCPTNPKIKSNLSATSGRKHFTVIHPDGSEDIVFNRIDTSQQTSLLQEFSNLETTEGFRIKCYDDSSATGIRLNSFDSAYYNFVLIY